MHRDNQIMATALERAPLLWERRQKILSRLGTDEEPAFRRRLKDSVAERDSRQPEIKDQAIQSLRRNGFEVRISPDPRELAALLAERMSGTEWLRSGSRLVNCLEKYLPGKRPMRTDIYERYTRECLLENKEYYPRNQTSAPDYSRLGLWSDAGADRDFFSGYLASLPEEHASLVGTNAITAEGQLLICENTGNINYLLMANELLFITSDEKLVSSPDVFFLWQRLFIHYGLRETFAAHTHILSRPSFTDTLPGKKTPFGGHHFSIGWMEDKKLEHAGVSCIECELCMEVCPAVELYGKDFSWNGYTGGVGILKAFLWEGREGLQRSNAWMCSDCGKCSLMCPVDFDIFSNIRQLKSLTREDTGFCELESSGKLLMEEYLFVTRKERVDHAGV
jgi:ferredoxin